MTDQHPACYCACHKGETVEHVAPCCFPIGVAYVRREGDLDTALARTIRQRDQARAIAVDLEQENAHLRSLIPSTEGATA